MISGFRVDASRSLEEARPILEGVLRDQGFNAHWQDENLAVAKRNSRLASFFLAWWFPYLRVAIRIFGDTRDSSIHVEAHSFGYLFGGLLTLAKNERALERFRDELTRRLNISGQGPNVESW
jgi:hypothetical protein